MKVNGAVHHPPGTPVLTHTHHLVCAGRAQPRGKHYCVAAGRASMVESLRPDGSRSRGGGACSLSRAASQASQQCFYR